jgi:prophage regulatory protein
MEQNATPNLQILRLKQVCERLQISRSSLYEKITITSPRFDKDFPRPFKLGASSIGFAASAVDKWVLGRIAVSSAMEGAK